MPPIAFSLTPPVLLSPSVRGRSALTTFPHIPTKSSHSMVPHHTVSLIYLKCNTYNYDIPKSHHFLLDCVHFDLKGLEQVTNIVLYFYFQIIS